MSLNEMNRRDFLKKTALTTAAIPAAALLSKEVFANEMKKEEKMYTEAEVVTEKDPMAIGLKYMHDATKAQRVDKAGVKAADQKCENCAVYGMMSKGKIAATKEAAGSCTFFGGRAVASGGWCTGWTKKA